MCKVGGELGAQPFYEHLRTETSFYFSIIINIKQNSAVSNCQLFENFGPMSGFRTVINFISLHQTFWGHTLLTCISMRHIHKLELPVTSVGPGVSFGKRALQIVF